jgi:hypothetical protein
MCGLSGNLPVQRIAKLSPVVIAACLLEGAAFF